MKSPAKSIFLLGLILPLLPVRPALGWYDWPHRVIAEIAEIHLDQDARQEVAFLLGEKTRMADVANWADQIRHDCWWTAPWHFINWPLELEIPDYDVLATRRGNVVWAVEKQLAIFRDRQKSREDRREALEFVIHFVGDLHEPLHCGQREDRGGNSIPVLFQGRRINLHAAWDGEIYDTGGETPARHAAGLLEGLQPAERDRIMRGCPYDWAVESHRIDRDFVYARLPDLTGDAGRPQAPELSGPYAEAARPIIRRRLLEAGLRLAYLLNQAVANASPQLPATPTAHHGGSGDRTPSPNK